MTEPVFLSGRDVLLCHCRIEHGMRAWIKPYFIREAEPKMFLSPWRISLAESQDAYFVCCFILSTFCYVLGRVAPRILKHSTRIMVCLGKGKYKHLNFSFLFFHLLVAHLLQYLVEWLWRLRRSLNTTEFQAKLSFGSWFLKGSGSCHVLG